MTENLKGTLTFKNPRSAFERAIRERRLSCDPANLLYAGYYMYMGTNREGRDTFKHWSTREYIK